MSYPDRYPPSLVPSKCYVQDCPNLAGVDLHGRPRMGMRCDYHRSMDPRSIEDTSDGGPLDEQWAPERRQGTWRRLITRLWSEVLVLAALVFLVAWLLGAL